MPSWSEIQDRIKNAINSINKVFYRVEGGIQRIQGNPVLDATARIAISAIPYVGPSLLTWYDSVGKSSTDKAVELLQFLEELQQQNLQQFNQISKDITENLDAIIRNSVKLDEVLEKTGDIHDYLILRHYNDAASLAQLLIALQGKHDPNIKKRIGIIAENLGMWHTVDSELQYWDNQTDLNHILESDRRLRYAMSVKGRELLYAYDIARYLVDLMMAVVGRTPVDNTILNDIDILIQKLESLRVLSSLTPYLRQGLLDWRDGRINNDAAGLLLQLIDWYLRHFSSKEKVIKDIKGLFTGDVFPDSEEFSIKARAILSGAAKTFPEEML